MILMLCLMLTLQQISWLPQSRPFQIWPIIYSRERGDLEVDTRMADIGYLMKGMQATSLYGSFA